MILTFYCIAPKLLDNDKVDSEDITHETTVENHEAIEYFSDRNNLVNVLSVVSAIPPPVPVNPSCSAPPDPEPVCQDPGLSHRMTSPRKLAIMMLFSFEVDTLEIAFKEMLDIVDIVFLIEATKSHKGEPKPLMWERIKYEDRFSFVNQTKIVHIIIDDLVDSQQAKSNIWYAERFQTQMAIRRMKLWNSFNNFLGKDDLLISANVDEMMSRQALVNLRHCQTSDDVISAALWMPMGNFNRAFRTDFPVVGRNHTFGVPTIYKWGGIVGNIYAGERLQFLWKQVMKVPRDKYVLGGVHMTDPANLITYMLKELTATESRGFVDDNFLRYVGSKVTLETLYSEQDRLYNLEYKPFWVSRFDPVESVTDVEPTIPWWLSCNKDRFPYWFGHREPRLKFLYQALLQPELYKMDDFMFS